MPADAFQVEVARVALSAGARYGLALGGGQALIAHGLVDRPTADVDLFTDVDGGAADAADAVAEALEAAGFVVTRVAAMDDLADLFEGFALDMVEWDVRREARVVRLSLARLDRSRETVSMAVGPVIHVDDLVASKVTALVDRGQIRDFVDVAAALDRYSLPQLVRLARRFDPGLVDRDFTDAGARLDALPDDRFAVYGLTPADVDRLRERLAEWPRPGAPVPG